MKLNIKTVMAKILGELLAIALILVVLAGIVLFISFVDICIFDICKPITLATIISIILNSIFAFIIWKCLKKLESKLAIKELYV